MRKHKHTALLLTKGEARWIAWALDAMECLPEYEKLEILGARTPILPALVGKTLRLEGCSEDVIEDLLYRLEEQAYDVCDTDSVSEQQRTARWQPAKRAAGKIRQWKKIAGGEGG